MSKCRGPLAITYHILPAKTKKTRSVTFEHGLERGASHVKGLGHFLQDNLKQIVSSAHQVAGRNDNEESDLMFVSFIMSHAWLVRRGAHCTIAVSAQ
jgi:hypothetical protein